MATKIVTKNSSTASAVPTASDLVQGELAVNVADKRLFTEDNAGSIIELGTKPSTIDINAGTIDGTAIGASSASTGAFTTLTATGAFTSVGIDDNATSTAITIDSSENVGIGTSSPTTLLDLNKAQASETILRVGNTSTSAGSGSKITAEGSSNKSTDVGIRSINDAAYGALDAESGYVWYDGATSLVLGATNGAGIIKFNTGGIAERMRIDSSGNVGIGNTVASSMDGGANNLVIGSGSGTEGMTIYSGTTNSGTVYFADGASGDDRFRGQINYAHSDNSLNFRTNASSTPQMTLDSSGNVGIGTSSPAYELDVKSSGEADIRIDSATGNDGALRFAENGTNVFTMYHDAANSALAFYDNANTTERMRIDSSGNLLVGSTSDSGTDYHYLKSDGFVRHKRAGGIVGVFDRGTSDGDIVLFRKDGSTVGSIGSAYRGASGDSLYFVAGDTGIVASPSDDSIVPVTTNGAGRDAAINLGTSSTRFKDLYLSGGVYLGGTGAANKLDDYEEGTFSGTAAGSVYSGTYTKVGRICHISMTIDNTNSTGTQLASLPFSSKNGGTSFNGSQPTFNSSSTQAGFYVAPYNGGAALFGYSRLGATINISSGSIAANFTYETD